MKKILTTFLLVCGAVSNSQAQTLFSQDFSAGGTTTDYVNASPSTGQWNAISTSGAAKTWSIASNTLQLISTGANAAYASRTTDFSSIPSVMQFSFTFNLVSSSTNLTSALDIAVGSGFNTNNSTESNTNVYAKFGVNINNASGYVVRDISGTTNGATTFTGANTFTWVANNSGASTTYLAPDGSTESIADDTWDLWVGTSRQLNDRAATTPTQTITDFKFGSTGTSTFTAQFDNFAIAAIPEPTTITLIGFGLFGLALHRRRLGRR